MTEPFQIEDESSAAEPASSKAYRTLEELIVTLHLAPGSVTTKA